MKKKTKKYRYVEIDLPNPKTQPGRFMLIPYGDYLLKFEKIDFCIRDESTWYYSTIWSKPKKVKK